MAIAARQNNGKKRDLNPSSNTSNSRGAWRGSRPNFSQSHQGNRNAGGPPPQGYSNQQQAPLHNIETALNASVTVFTRNGGRHTGVLAAVDADGSGFTLRNHRDIAVPSMPEQESMHFPGVQLAGWQRNEPPPNTNGSGTPKGFRTDMDISQAGRNLRERELQAWSDSSPSGLNGATPNGLNVSPSVPKGDEVTFGSNNASWDQFSANQQLFGVTTSYDEELYTTRLDRSRPDFKDRERQAAQIANEIQNTTTNNPHIAEERTTNTLDDSGVNEEDKYGAVVRSDNAYVPPGARGVNPSQVKVVGSSNATPGAGPSAEAPKLAVHGPAPGVDGAAQDNNLVGSFRNFVSNERQRLAQKRQQVVKKEKDNRLAELLKFSKEFKLNRPIPGDLVPILAKDETKQKELLEKSRREAESAGARAIGAQIITANSASRAPPPAVPAGKQNLPREGTIPPGPAIAATPAAARLAIRHPPAIQPVPVSATPGSTFIQKIPPFRGKRSDPAQTAVHSTGPTSNNAATGTAAAGPSRETVTPASPPMSPTSAAFKLNVKASSFRPNAAAAPFRPGVSSPPAASPSPGTSKSRQELKADSPPQPHPFFGKNIPKMTPVHIKDEFNPFKNAKIPEASTICEYETGEDDTPTWPYNGKRYMSMFPPIQAPAPQPQGPSHQNQAAQPPPFEEDPAQAAARAAVPYPMMYTYAPYPYGAQQMMPLGPGGAPPAGYLPYMQPMHYQPQHQSNGPPSMYAPQGLNGIPPPQGYLPHPGPYSQTNGAGPRGSMPPTPMPQHAYAFHQSPQLTHPGPYPMMMGQPPPLPPQQQQPYDGQGAPQQQGPPGQMNTNH